jgi:hypothetical protein
MRSDNQSVTPNLAETIQALIDATLVEVHICLPGRVTAYDASTQKASIQVSLLRKYEAGNTDPWPIIPNVPVIFPRAANGQTYSHFPLESGNQMTPGDNVTLVVCERSLDNWKLSQSALIDPESRRKFSMTDAYAIPGGSATPLVFDDPQAYEIRHKLSMLQMKAEGILNLKAQMVNIGINPGHPAGLGDAMEARLTAIENKLTSLCGDYTAHTHIITTAPGTSGGPLPANGPFTPDTSVVESETVMVST